MSKTVFKMFFSLLALFVLHTRVVAEDLGFIKTGANVYQNLTCGHVAIVFSELGFFLTLSTASKNALQSFNPEQTLIQDSQIHFFVKYRDGQPRSLLLGARSYPLTGSFTLQAAATSFICDAQSGGYCSLTVACEDGTSTLGLIGQNVILNVSGIPAAVLRANDYHQLIKPYNITPAGLLLNGENVLIGNTLGLDLQAKSKNICVRERKKRRFIAQKDYERLGSIVNKQDKERELRAILRRNDAEPLNYGVILKDDQTTLIIFDAANGQLLNISPVGTNLCLYNTVEFG